MFGEVKNIRVKCGEEDYGEKLVCNVVVDGDEVARVVLDGESKTILDLEIKDAKRFAEVVKYLNLSKVVSK